MRKVQCPYCGRSATLQAHPSGSRFGKVWKCDPCDAWTGVHKGSRDHAPLGRIADEELRRLKTAAHAAFDPLWKRGHMSRTAAYKLLTRRMKNTRSAGIHIGFLSPDRCREVIEISERLLANIEDTD